MCEKPKKTTACIITALLCTAVALPSTAQAGGVALGGFLEKRKEVLKARFDADPKNQKIKADYVKHLKRIGAGAADYDYIKARLFEHNLMKRGKTLKMKKMMPHAPQAMQFAAYAPNNNAEKDELSFKKAKYLEKKGEWEMAERHYQQILKESPDANRVKLDLATLYAKQGYNQDSKVLFKEVLESSPPEAVKDNITKAIKHVDSKLKRNEFSGIALLGVNSDTNGNSVATSGNVIVNDVQVPLTSSSQAKEDFQIIALVALNHRYNFDYERNDIFKTRWFSGVSAYMSQQNDLNELDLRLVTVKTGPNFTSQGGTELGYNIGYTVVELDGENYLDTVSNELYINHPFTNKFSVRNSAQYEHRHFINSPTNNTIADRTGEAYQIKQTASYTLSPEDLLSFGYSIRREEARQTKYDNDQLSFTLSYLHAFKNGILANVKSSYRITEYDEADPFISTTTARQDKEGIGGVSLSSKLGKKVTGVVGYEYKDVDSNLTNYQHKNHRISTSVSYGF